MEPIKMSYPPLMLLQVFSFVVLVSVVVSWIPARRIARMKATDALRGKVV
jgi:ABC-type antimicrobial peptide transport system permease subunit